MLKLHVHYKNFKFVTLYDSGSNFSLINSKIIKYLDDKIESVCDSFSTLNGTSKCNGRVKLRIKIGNIEKILEFFIIDENRFKYDMLLGLDGIKAFRLKQNQQLRITQEEEEERVLKIEDDAKLNVIDKEEVIRRIYNVEEEEDENLDRDKRSKITRLLNENISSFAIDKYDVGRVKNNEAHVKLTVEKYVSRRPYRTTAADRREIEEQVKRLLDAKLIVESNSPFASPVTLAYKKEENRKSRLCIDFTALNKLVVPESYPFPRIEDLLDRTYSCKYFTTLDINSAFWSIPIRVEDRSKLAFITQEGHYEFNVLPFGFRNAPCIFQRILSNILRRNNLNNFCVNYIDDLLIFSESFEEHIQHVQKVLEVIRNEGFKLKFSKCKFAKRKVVYLSHVLQEGRVSPVRDNLIGIKDFPTPTTVTQVRQFLGKLNYWLKFIGDRVNRLEPLHRLLKKKNNFDWTNECEWAFKDLKQYLCSEPVLQIFNPNKMIYIQTDASGVGVGGILKQEGEDGILHPCAYFSKKIPIRTRKEPAIVLECLAIKECIMYWFYYLMGNEFIVLSDHKPLENLRVKSRPDEKLGDMIVYLSQFNFKIVYQKGKDNIEADALSRNPVLEHFCEEEIIYTSNLLTLEEIREDQQLSDKEKNKLKFKIKNGKKRITITRKLANRLIDKVHKEFGHIGQNKILAMIRPKYHIRDIDKLVKEYCNKCDICLMNKSRIKQTKYELKKLGPPTEPYEVMSLDTIGGFNNCRSPKKYLHLLIDHFTRFCWMITSKSQTAEDFINLMNLVDKSIPIKTLLVDKYSGITSNTFKKYIKSRNINLLFTSTDCPTSNGNIERANQTITNRLRCKFYEKKGSWPTLARECIDEYNRSIHTTTGFAPKYLLTGEETMLSPIDSESNLEADRRKANEKSREDFERNRERLNKGDETKFEENDLVYVQDSSKLNRSKLEPIRTGPHKVIRQVSPQMYEIDTNKRTPKLIHRKKLTPLFEKK